MRVTRHLRAGAASDALADTAERPRLGSVSLSVPLLLEVATA